MKKSILLLTILLISCSPQVTVTSEVTVTSTSSPTETPIPTPTIHPQFISLQESIVASGGRYTLQADGTIQNGAETIPGLAVTPDGIMTLTVNGETVTLDPADVSFGEDGIEIEGYELDDNGDWVEAISPAEAQFNADMEKWKIDLDGDDKDKFEQITGIDGKISLVEKASGDVVYFDGAWDVMYLGKMITEGGSCKITPWEADQIGRATPKELRDFTNQYGQPLTDAYLLFVEKRMIVRTGLIIRTYYLGDKCWGETYYNDENQAWAWFFWKNESGQPTYEKVFMTSKK